MSPRRVDSAQSGQSRSRCLHRNQFSWPSPSPMKKLPKLEVNPANASEKLAFARDTDISIDPSGWELSITLLELPSNNLRALKKLDVSVEDPRTVRFRELSDSAPLSNHFCQLACHSLVKHQMSPLQD